MFWFLEGLTLYYGPSLIQHYGNEAANFSAPKNSV